MHTHTSPASLQAVASVLGAACPQPLSSGDIARVVTRQTGQHMHWQTARLACIRIGAERDERGRFGLPRS